MYARPGSVSVQHPHIEALRSKHAMLSAQIQDAQLHLSTRDEDIRQLKAERLRLKDKIAGQYG